MKVSFLVVLFFLFQWTAQTNHFEFLETYYNGDGSIYRQKLKKIESETDTIDLYFLRENFHVPYHFPDAFSNQNYKNESVTVWNNEEGEKDFQMNWTYTYTYDSLSRVVGYAYSGCIVCSQLPYHFKISYNEKGQVTELKEKLNGNERFVMEYDEQGNIRKLSCFSFKTLRRTIERKY